MAIRPVVTIDVPPDDKPSIKIGDMDVTNLVTGVSVHLSAHRSPIAVIDFEPALIAGVTAGGELSARTKAALERMGWVRRER